MSNTQYLTGQFLIAMPQMTEKPFARSLIFLCAHTAEGAMGLIINQRAGTMTFKDVFGQLEMEATADEAGTARVNFGGPVEPRRGFVLHSTDRLEESSLVVSEEVALTSTVDMLRAIAQGTGPPPRPAGLRLCRVERGPARSRNPKQFLLSVDPDDALLFDADLDTKWHRAIAKLGVDITMLSSEAGHA
ncbi:YqgE/AlgH family protein [Elstera litoralis]|uniref:YqgE/AlgH family protein n=1 Tax=Elstera litoralis TaxID=552518 RepID=UPI000B2AC4D6